MEGRPDTWLDIPDIDVLVLGTGILHSLVACALARAGKRVIHLDQNLFYGEHEAALTMQDLCAFLNRQATQPPAEPLAFLRDATPFSNVIIHADPSAEEFLKKESRAFSIDLCPRPIFADDTLVRVFVRSGVHQYLEFKTLDKLYMSSPDGRQLLPVPRSRNDVFSSKVVDLKEKRLLMRFIETCNGTNAEFMRDHGSEKFVDWLRSQGLTPNLQSFLLYAITLSRTDQAAPSNAEVVTVSEGISRLKLFMTSSAIYGSPFLYPLYGLGEISQAYCRAAAVSGATYVLHRTLTRLVLGEDGAVTGAVDSEGQEHRAKTIVTSSAYVRNCTPGRRLARCIAVLDGPLVHGEARSTLTVVPPGTFGNAAAVHALQLDSSLHVCPKNKFLLHLTTQASEGRTAQEELAPVVRALCAEDAAAAAAPAPAPAAASEDSPAPARPAVLWLAYFNQSTFTAPATVPAGLHVLPETGALPGVSWGPVLEAAERTFHAIVPGAEFLARPVGQPEETQEAATDGGAARE